MGIVQKDALRTTLVSYFGLILGYVNKVFLFLWLLTTAEIGLINLIFTLGTLFAQFANLGTVNTIWKFFPYVKNEPRKHYGFLTLNLLIVACGILFFSSLILLFSTFIVDRFKENSALFTDYYLWVIPVGIGVVLYKVLDMYLRALYKNVFSVIANEVIFRIAQSIILVLFAAEILNFDQLLISLCLAQFIPPLLIIFYLRRIGEWHFSLKSISIPAKLRSIIVNYSSFSYINSLAAVLVISLDSIMIAQMIGLSGNGVYSMMVFLTAVLMVPYTSIIRVSAPLVSEHWKTRNMKEMGKLYRQVSSVSLFIGLFLFMCVWVNRLDFLSFLSPEKQSDFLPGIYVFLALMCGRMLDMYFGLNGSILVSSKKYKYDILFTSVLILVVILLNLWLIPIWGIVGAAISTACAYFGYNVIRLIFVWYHYKLHPFSKSQLLVLIIFVFNVMIFEWLPMDIGNAWLNIASKTALFGLLFPLPVYFLNVEPEIVTYVDKVKAKIFGK